MYYITPIAKPLADQLLEKKVFKLVNKAAKAQAIKRGVKEINKSFRKKPKGILILAADVYPLDVISHLPILCEENNCAYVFVTSKSMLGSAAGTKRNTSCIFIDENKISPDLKKYYTRVFESL